MREYLRSASATMLSPLSFLSDSNAVLSRELRVTLRNERAFALMAIYVAILGAIIASKFPADVAVQVTARPGTNSQGRELFTIFWVAQAMMVTLLLPALAAGSLAQERERQTLEPLLLTPLTPGQIVWGKAVGVLLFGVLLLLATVPVTSLCFLLNGISPADVISAYAVLIGLAAFVTGFGLYCSARWHSAMQATLACYLLLPLAIGTLVIFMGPGSIVAGVFLLGSLFYRVAMLHKKWKETKFARKIRGGYNLLFVFLAALMLTFIILLIRGSWGLGWSIFLLVFVTPYLLFVARLGLERTGEEIAKRPQPRRPTPERLSDLKAEWEQAVAAPPVVYLPSATGRFTYTPQTPPPTATAPVKATYNVKAFLPDKWNPVMAKDLRVGLLGNFTYLGRFSYVMVIVTELWLLLRLWNYTSGSMSMEQEFATWFTGWAGYHLALLMAAGVLFGARALAPEREQQTLPQLLTTPLPPLSIVLGKMMAVLVYMSYVFVLAAPMTIFLAVFGLLPLSSAIAFLALEITLGALAAAWGIICSMEGVTVRRALGFALGGVVALFFLNLIIHEVLLADVPNTANVMHTKLPLFLWLALGLDRFCFPLTVMSGITAPSAQLNAIRGASWHSLVSASLFALLTVILLLKTCANFRRYAQTV